MFIWRLEDKDGVGPYALGYCRGCKGDYYSWKRNPGPEDDGLPSHSSRLTYGFKSITQTRTWFNSRIDCQRWSSEGVSLAVYNKNDLNALHIGKRQCSFERRETSRIRIKLEYLHALPAAAIIAMAKAEYKWTKEKKSGYPKTLSLETPEINSYPLSKLWQKQSPAPSYVLLDNNPSSAWLAAMDNFLVNSKTV